MNKSDDNKTYLSFCLGGEFFGANVRFILEVLKKETITEIPRSEDFIVGIINFRGEIVTVIDLYKKLNMPTPLVPSKDLIIVLELFEGEKSTKVGIIADKVRKVFEISNEQLMPVPEFGKYYNPEYLTGVAKTADGFVLTLDIEKVLNEKDVRIIKNISKEETKK